jgi:hypothetical protein
MHIYCMTQHLLHPKLFLHCVVLYHSPRCCLISHCLSHHFKASNKLPQCCITPQRVVSSHTASYTVIAPLANSHGIVSLPRCCLILHCLSHHSNKPPQCCITLQRVVLSHTTSHNVVPPPKVSSHLTFHTMLMPLTNSYSVVTPPNTSSHLVLPPHHHYTSSQHHKTPKCIVLSRTASYTTITPSAVLYCPPGHCLVF